MVQAPAKRRFKNSLFEQFARIGRALSNAHRIELLDVLAQGERAVEQLASETDLTIANASQHLQILRQAELVVSRREGTRVLYALAGPDVFALYQALRTTGEAQLAQIKRVVATYLADRAQMEEIGPEELQRRLASGEVTLIDVRPTIESDQGRIVSALAIPVGELSNRMSELPPGRTIVAYCRGPYCVYADEAVAILRDQGRHAMRLTVGYPDWKAAGLPIEEISALAADGPADS